MNGAPTAAGSPVWSILQQLYSYVATLETAILQLCHIQLTKTNNHFHTFCTTTILVSNQKDAFSSDRCRRNLFSVKRKETFQSIISAIDKQASGRCATHTTELRLLHSIVGDEAMRFILTKTSLFVRSAATNYLQITGPPIYNVIGCTFIPLLTTKPNTSAQVTQNQHLRDRVTQGRANGPMTTKSKISRAKTSRASSASDMVHSSLNSSTIARLLPSNTHFLPRSSTGKTQRKRRNRRLCVKGRSTFPHGFRGKRLERRRKRITASLKRRSSFGKRSCPAERCQMRRLRTIWSRVVRKSDVMYSTSSREYLRRSHELNVLKDSRRGATKLVKRVFIERLKPQDTRNKTSTTQPKRLPRRYHSVIPLFQLLLSNYQRKNQRFPHILDHISPVSKAELEGGIHKALCNPHQVLRFLVSVINLVIPLRLFGCVENRDRFFHHLEWYVVDLRRWERVSVLQLVRGVKTTRCSWAGVGGARGCGLSDTLKRKEMVACFLCWVMELVVDLVKGFFYATEHSDHHNRVVYYRKKVWEQLCQTALNERSVMFHQLSQEEVDMQLSRGKSLGVSNLRFMPKPSSLRPITNLGAIAKLDSCKFVLNEMRQREAKPVNSQLVDLFSILKFEKARRVGSTSCMGHGDVHSRLKTFSLGLPPQDRQPFFTVHLDITNSFDSIVPRLLYSIIQKKVITQKSYLLRRYATVMVSNQMIKRLFVKVATTRDQCQSFVEFAKSLNVRNAIIADLVSYPVIDRLQILSQLKSHLFHNIVKFRGRFFGQKRGIPQGSCVSSLLCSFYYDEMVEECLPKFDPKKELLLHYIDDFLLMTHDQEKAKTFLDTMTKGVAEYNCFINPLKTQANFTVNEDGSLTLDECKEWMPWCGIQVNTKTLEVRSDYARYSNKKIRDHLSVITHPKPFLNLCHLIRRAVRLKCRPVLMDCQLLSEGTVLCNVYQLFLLMAVKTHTALRTLHVRGQRIRKYTKFLHSLILQSARYLHSRGRTKCRGAQEGCTTFAVPIEICTWLCCHAYQRVLQARDSRGYSLLLKIVSSQISTLSDTMGLPLVKKCFRATTAACCNSIIRLKC